MKNIMRILGVVALLLIVLSGCKIELAVPEGEEKPGTETPEEPVETADTETAKAYLGAFDNALFLKDLHAILKGEKADGVVTTLTAGVVAFDGDKTELTIPLTFTGYDFDGKGEESTAGLYTRTATGKATLIFTGETAENIYSADSYSVKDVDITFSVGKAEGYVSLTLPDMKITATEIKGAVTGAEIQIAVDESGKASGIVDVDTPKFGAATGEITIDGIKADVADL